MCDRFAQLVELQLNQVGLWFGTGSGLGLRKWLGVRDRICVRVMVTVQVSIRLSVTIRPGDRANSSPTVGPEDTVKI